NVALLAVHDVSGVHNGPIIIENESIVVRYGTGRLSSRIALGIELGELALGNIGLKRAVLSAGTAEEPDSICFIHRGDGGGSSLAENRDGARAVEGGVEPSHYDRVQQDRWQLRREEAVLYGSLPALDAALHPALHEVIPGSEEGINPEIERKRRRE